MPNNRGIDSKERERIKSIIKAGMKGKGYTSRDVSDICGKSYGHVRNTLSTKACLPPWLIDFAKEKGFLN